MPVPCCTIVQRTHESLKRILLTAERSFTLQTTLELTGDAIIHVAFCLECLIMLACGGDIFSQFDYNFLEGKKDLLC